MCDVVKKLYRAIRHQQPMLIIKGTSVVPGPLKCVLHKAYVVGMRSLEYQIGRGFGPRGVPVNPSGFLGPKQSLCPSSHATDAGARNSLPAPQLLSPPA